MQISKFWKLYLLVVYNGNCRSSNFNEKTPDGQIIWFNVSALDFVSESMGLARSKAEIHESMEKSHPPPRLQLPD